MFIGLYWPRVENMDYCVPNPAASGVLGRPLARGVQNGADFTACIGEAGGLEAANGSGPESSERRYRAQKCVADLCPEVSGRLNEGLDLSTLTCD